VSDVAEKRQQFAFGDKMMKPEAHPAAHGRGSARLIEGKSSMPNYFALIDGKLGAYGVVFPDVPGCHAMGKTMEKALLNAKSALKDWIALANSVEGFGVPKPRTIGELLRDPEVIEQIKATGAVLREVRAARG
jgi:predicted RNase H-like HicB family nuclease